MNEKQGAAEWMRGIIDEYKANKRICPEKAKMFGIDCSHEKSCIDCEIDKMTAVADRIDAERALPSGMEWPRFEDGELVKVGDEVEHKGETMRVYLATLDADGWALWCSREGVDGRLSGSYGERVKRPAPKVFDADGVPIKVGDIVYRDADPEPLQVELIYAGSTCYCTVRLKDSAGKYITTDAPRLSHKKPEPADSWERLEEDAAKRVCEYAGAQKSIADDDKYSCINCPYDEPGHHTDKGCQERMRLDLVRRAKKLAKAGEVE